MEPTFYHKISKLIAKHQFQSITIDVFDTIILNEYWPSQLRYYDLSGKQLPVIHQFIAKQITHYELYDTRTHAAKLLQSSVLPQSLDIWLTETVELLCIKHGTILTNEQKLNLLAELIKIELEFIIENCHPNQKLITQLQHLKQHNPNLKLYFLNDSYLTSEQIKLLLQIYQIDLFDNGASIADLANHSKENLFEHLPQDFHLYTNLHLDDHRQNVRQLKKISAHALHYRPIRMRGLRTLIGQTWLLLLRHFTLRHARQFAPLDTWTTVGKIIALRNQITAQNLIAFSNLHTGNYLLTVETPNLEPLHQPNFYHAEALNKDTIIQAFIWLLSNYSSPRWNAPELLKFLLQETNITSRVKLYQTCFTSDYVYSKLAVTSFSETKFYQIFLDEIRTAAPAYTQSLRQAYELALSLLPTDQYTTTFFVTMHNDSAAELFREFARLHNIATPIKGLALNPDPTFQSTEKYIANYINNYQKSQIQLGQRLANEISYELAPETYLQKVLQPQLRHLTKRYITPPKIPKLSLAKLTSSRSLS